MPNVLDSISAGAIVVIRDRLMALQASGQKVYRLESGDPSFPIPSWVDAAMRDALTQNQTHYTESMGIKPLRQALLTKVQTSNGLSSISSLDHVMVTSGAMHGLYLVFQAVMEDERDEVLIPDPMWTEVGDNIKLAGGVPVRVPMTELGGWDYVGGLEANIGPKTRAIFINSPHNPTGSIISRESLQLVVKLAVRHDLLIISDEAYEHVQLGDVPAHISIGSLEGAADRTISLFSSSKSYSMSGLRVGYLTTSKLDLMDRIRKLSRCTVNGVNSVAQWGLLAAMDPANKGAQDAYHREMNLTYKFRRDCLVEALRPSPYVHFSSPEGAFFLWLRLTEAGKARFGSGQGLSDEMLRFGVGSAPGSVFGPAGVDCVRLAFSCETTQVAAAAKVLQKLLGP